MRNQIRTDFSRYKQVFPAYLDKLNIIYKKKSPNRKTLEELSERLDSYQKKELNPTTEEGEWFCGLYFKTRKGITAILFPWEQYDKKFHINKLKKPIAVYTKGRIDVEYVNNLIEKLYQGLETVQNNSEQLIA